ncbi:hypothetical protein [Streptomyces sp. NPDC048516]
MPAVTRTPRNSPGTARLGSIGGCVQEAYGERRTMAHTSVPVPAPP